MESIAEDLANWCIKHGVNNRQEERIKAGIQLMLNSSVKFIIILSIAWLQGCFTIMALSLVSFGIFRSFAGGRHFKTDIGCLMGMLGIGEVTLLITYHSQKLPTILLIFGLSTVN